MSSFYMDFVWEKKERKTDMLEKRKNSLFTLNLLAGNVLLEVLLEGKNNISF